MKYDKEYTRNCLLIMRREGYPTDVILEHLEISKDEYDVMISKDWYIVWDYEKEIIPVLKSKLQLLCGLPNGTMKECAHFKNCHNGARCVPGRMAAARVVKFDGIVTDGRYGQGYKRIG